VDESTSVALDGTASTDPDGVIASYSWMQTAGTPVSLDDASSATPSFMAPPVDAGTISLVFELTVTDDENANDTDTVSINVSDQDVVVPTYGLGLVEGGDPSDGVVNLDQDLTAVAETTDKTVNAVIFTWKSPSGGFAREATVAGDSSFEDTFAPTEPGDWEVRADFGNGQVVVKTVTATFFVLPESPIGALAMIVTSTVILGGFLYLRTRKNPSGLG
jgi:hypothetical protein